MTHEAGQAAEIGEVERAGMGRAVSADEAGAVDREAHRQLLDRHVMHDLIVGALQEGRIDRRERLHALGGEAGGKGHGMLLGDADIEACASGKRSPKVSRPVPDGIAAVIATMRSSASASSISALAKTLV